MEDNSHAGQGAVMLDVGGDIGALVVTMPAAMAGIEIEIRPVGESAEHEHHEHEHDGHDHDHEHGQLIHVAVIGRPANGQVHYTAVYPELTTGMYELYERPAGPVKLTASVTGGEVTEAVWPI